MCVQIVERNLAPAFALSIVEVFLPVLLDDRLLEVFYLFGQYLLSLIRVANIRLAIEVNLCASVA